MSSRSAWWVLGASFAASISTAPEASATELSVSTMCTVDKTCRVRIAVGDGPNDAAVTTLQANRVGPDMRYFPAEHDGALELEGYSFMYLDSPVVLDDTGTMRAPETGDPPGEILTFTQTVGFDGKGHVTFFSGVATAKDEPLPRKVYVWGYPPTTTKMVGMIGGPRSPVVPNRPGPPQLLRGGTALNFHLAADGRHRCSVIVNMASESEVGSAVTHFRANRVGEDMRYFPRETEGGTSVVGGAATYVTDLDVVLEDGGGMRRAEPDDAPGDVGTLTSTIALDARGHVTFFYGFVRATDSSHVRRFYLWGYPPGTFRVDAAGRESEVLEGDLGGEI